VEPGGQWWWWNNPSRNHSHRHKKTWISTNLTS